VIAGGEARAARSTNALSRRQPVWWDADSAGNRRNASSHAARHALGRSQSIHDGRLRFLEDFVRYKHVHGMAKVPAGALRDIPAAAVPRAPALTLRARMPCVCAKLTTTGKARRRRRLPSHFFWGAFPPAGVAAVSAMGNVLAEADRVNVLISRCTGGGARRARRQSSSSPPGKNAAGP
jgi:hypothetical protein